MHLFRRRAVADVAGVAATIPVIGGGPVSAHADAPGARGTVAHRANCFHRKAPGLEAAIAGAGA